MQFLREVQVFDDGSKLWLASAVPTLFSDNPAGFGAGDLLQLLGPSNTQGRFYLCTVGSVLTPGATAAAVFKPISVGQVNTPQYTQFWTTVTPPLGLTPGATQAGSGALPNGLTNTAGVQYQTWVAAVYIDSACTLTGIAVAIGNTGGTDKIAAGLYDAAGNLLASSASGSSAATAGTANTFQKLAFTATLTVAGPALHFIAVQTNGTTADIQTIPTGIMPAGIIAAGTSLVLPATITAPSTFTTNQGPCASTY